MSHRLTLLAIVSPVLFACGSSSESTDATGGAAPAQGTGGGFPATGGATFSSTGGGIGVGTGGAALPGTGGTSSAVATGGNGPIATGGQTAIATGGATATLTGGTGGVPGGIGGTSSTVTTGGFGTGGATGAIPSGGTSATGEGGTTSMDTGGASTGGTGSGTGGSTGVGTEYAVGDGAFVTACGWTGYAWTSADERSSITPESYSDLTTDAQLCATGSVAADPDYASYAMIGINIGQQNTGEDDPPNAEIVPDGTGLYVDLANAGGSDVRIQIQDALGGDDPDHRWCANYTGPGVIEWGTFNTECWNDGGAFYAMEPINAVLVMIPSSNEDEVPFDVCVNKISPEGSASCSGGGETGTGGTSGTGGTTGTENTGGTDATGGTTNTGGTTGGIVVDCDLPAAGSPGVAAPSGAANGIEVLDWAGFKSAVSYSFDDANSSQLSNFDAMMALGVHFTFYLQTGKSDASNPKWGTAAEAGHELGNHTQSHQQNGTASDVDAATAFIKDTFGVTPYTMAAPYGNTSYVSLAQSRFIINRGVSEGSMAPNGNTDPFNILGNMPAQGAQASAMNQIVDSARSQGNWQVFTIHGFTGGSDQAYQPIPFDSFVENVEYVKGQGDVWIDSVVNVGAYWIAQKLLSSVSPTSSDGGSTWSWQLPANFPPGMCLRVTTGGGTLSQDGQALAWDDHGYYQIALDAGSVTLTP